MKLPAPLAPTHGSPPGRRPHGWHRQSWRRALLAGLLAVGGLLPGCGLRPPPHEPMVVRAITGSLERYDASQHGFVRLGVPTELHSGDVLRTGPEARHLLALPYQGQVSLEASSRFTLGALQDAPDNPEVWLRLQEGHAFVVAPARGHCVVESYRCRLSSLPGSRSSVDVREDRDRFTNTLFRCYQGGAEVYGPRRKDPPLPLAAGYELRADDSGVKTATPTSGPTPDPLDPLLPLPQTLPSNAPLATPLATPLVTPMATPPVNFEATPLANPLASPVATP